QMLASRVSTIAEQDRDFHLTDVRVRLSDGTMLHDATDMSVAAPEAQLDEQWDKLVAKFHSLVNAVLGDDRAHRIVEAIGNLADLDDVTSLMLLTSLRQTS
ncbi:MAG: hypothetical protein ABI206_12335, partial [Antricoccus sp.]